MAKRDTKVVPARKSRDDDSLLTRSAESLGRVIGSLQRQMQGTTRRMSSAAEDAMDALPEMPDLGRFTGSGSPKRSSARKTTGARKSGGTRKAASTRNRTAARKTTGAGKPAGSRKTAGARKAGRTARGGRK